MNQDGEGLEPVCCTPPEVAVYIEGTSGNKECFAGEGCPDLYYLAHDNEPKVCCLFNQYYDPRVPGFCAYCTDSPSACPCSASGSNLHFCANIPTGFPIAFKTLGPGDYATNQELPQNWIELQGDKRDRYPHCIKDRQHCHHNCSGCCFKKSSSAQICADPEETLI